MGSPKVKTGLAFKNRKGEQMTRDEIIANKADLGGANLSRANLSRANLGRTDLSGANLGGANLSRANLSRANLSRANLSRANLSRANLYGANLYGANLDGANLRGAYLGGANLHGANLSGAKIRDDTLITLMARAWRLEPGDPYEFFAFTLDAGGYKIMAGCRWLTPDEYAAHVAAEYPGTAKASETLAILDFFDMRARQTGVITATQEEGETK